MAQGEISTERKIFILVSLLFLNLLLISSKVVLKNQKSVLQNLIGNIITPFQIVFQKSIDFTTHHINHYLFLKNSFAKHYKLKKKFTRLKYENYLLKRKLKELRFLENIKITDTDFIVAQTISIDQNFPLSSIMINKGSRDGIKKHMVVRNQSGDLVGKIEEPITFFTSKVRLITSAIGGVGAYIKNDELEGFLTGNNNKECSFKYLMANKQVFIGDQVVTSGTDQYYPPYIPIGRVIKTQKNYLTLSVKVRPFFIEKSIKQLLILKNTGNE